MSDKLFSTPEVAKILGISRIAVFKQIKSGRLPAVKAGRSYFVAKKDLFDLYKKRLQKEQKKTPPRSPKKAVDPLDRF